MPNASSVATFTAPVVSSPDQTVGGLATSEDNLEAGGGMAHITPYRVYRHIKSKEVDVMPSEAKIYCTGVGEVDSV